jgi:hypothetical protein
MLEHGVKPESRLTESFNDFKAQTVDESWWFARLPLGAYGMSFVLFLSIESLRLAGMFMLYTRNDPYLTAQLSGLAGDLLFPLIFLLLTSLYDSVSRFRGWFNTSLREERFKPPLELTASLPQGQRKGIEQWYETEYLRKVYAKTVNEGFDLAFSPACQICSGLIACALVWIVSLKVPFIWGAPPDWYQAFDSIAHIPILYGLWFSVGMFSWTFFIILFTCLAVIGSGTADFRTEVGLSFYLSPIMDMILKATTSLAIILAWISPILFIDAILTSGPAKSPPIFAEGVTIAAIIVIFLSFMVPTSALHVTMKRSKIRKVTLLEQTMSELEANHPSDSSEQSRKEALHDHERALIRAGRVETWPVNLVAVLNFLGVLLLPLVTFLVSSGALR